MDASIRMRRALVQHLESLQRAGVREIPKVIWEEKGPATAVSSPLSPARTADRTTDGAARAASGPQPVSAQTVTRSGENSSLPRPSSATARISSQSILTPTSAGIIPPNVGLSLADRLGALEVLQQEVCNCQACPALVSNRSRTVFGVGSPQPRLCFFGEAPGADEDRVGVPFVGRAGQLLDKILEACTLKREEVYILNTLKCRPPDNRAPIEEEVENCRGFFERQLAILRPEFICCLGATAAKALLRSTLALGRLRGQFHDFRGAKVLVTYHPAYLLRNPAAKKDTWEDMKLLLNEMGIQLPKTS